MVYYFYLCCFHVIQVTCLWQSPLDNFRNVWTHMEALLMYSNTRNILFNVFVHICSSSAALLKWYTSYVKRWVSGCHRASYVPCWFDVVHNILGGESKDLRLYWKISTNPLEDLTNWGMAFIKSIKGTLNSQLFCIAESRGHNLIHFNEYPKNQYRSATGVI